MVNYLAIILAAVAYMVIGTGWYTLFATPWMELTGVTKEDNKNMPKKIMFATINALVMAFVVALVFSYVGVNSVIMGLGIGLLLWIGFVATVLFSGVIWENRPIKLYLINAGSFLVSILAMSAIIAAV